MTRLHSLPKVAVTGGTGFIGRRLLERLRQGTGYSPVAIARPSSNVMALERVLDYVTEEPPVRIADFGDPVALDAAVRGISSVVHLAAEMDFFPGDPDAVIDTNVEVTRRLLQACAREVRRRGDAPKIRFIFISSTEAMGPVAGASGHGAVEDDPCSPDCVYGRSKLLAEKVALSQEFGDTMDVRVLRPTGVYGPNEDFFFRELVETIDAGLLCLSPGPLTGCIQFSHVDDVVDAIFSSLSAEGDVPRILNVCPDEVNVSYADVADTIADSLGRTRALAVLPLSFAMRVVWLLGPILNFQKRRIFLFHPDSLRKTLASRVYSNRAIKDHLDYLPRPMLSGISECIRGEIADGRIRKRPVSPLAINLVRLAGLGVFVLARLSMASEPYV